MDDMRRIRLGKSPANPIPLPRPQPFTVMAPTTLSNAFSMRLSSGFLSRPGSVSDETEMVDLNVPLPVPEVDQRPLSTLAPPATIRHIPTLDQALEKEMKDGCTLDPKKLRRTISNRLSAQRSRLRKAQYVAELEQKIHDLQETIALLNPQIEHYRIKQRALRDQKATLEEQLHNCITKSNMCNIQIEDNKREVERLRELQDKQAERMLFASCFGRERPPSFNIYGSHHSPMEYEEQNPINHDPVVVDQYINFDALN